MDPAAAAVAGAALWSFSGVTDRSTFFIPSRHSAPPADNFLLSSSRLISRRVSGSHPFSDNFAQLSSRGRRVRPLRHLTKSQILFVSAQFDIDQHAGSNQSKKINLLVNSDINSQIPTRDFTPEVILCLLRLTIPSERRSVGTVR